MSFGRLLEGKLGGAQPKKRKAAPSAIRNHSETLERKLALGSHVALALRDRHGDACFDGVAGLSADGSDAEVRHFPHGFWKHFISEEVHLEYNNRNRVHALRCFYLYIERSGLGGNTRLSMRDGARGGAKRRRGAEHNACKARGLGFALLQWFIDEIQVLRSRADSALVLNEARRLRHALLEAGWASEDLPKLDGGAGNMWIYRWRLEYGLSIRACGMQLKVLWSKVKSRCRTHLTNLFRIAFFGSFATQTPQCISSAWTKNLPGSTMLATPAITRSRDALRGMCARTSRKLATDTQF